MPKQAAWDKVLAKTLWDEGLTCKQIALQLEVSVNTIQKYAKQAWPGYMERVLANMPPRRAVKPSPLPSGARTLPPLLIERLPLPQLGENNKISN